MSPIISIIIPCYNQAEYLPETLQSVLDQDFKDWECLIINDGSSDETEEIALKWSVKDQRFRYYAKENSGLAHTRNYGISLAEGEFILPLDSDDIVSPEYLEEALKVFTLNPKVKLVYSNLILFGKVSRKIRLSEYAFENMFIENQIFCSAIFRKSDFIKTSGYNSNMLGGLEDWDFWLSFLTKDDCVVKLDGFYFHYRIKEESMLTSISKENNEQLLLQIFKNNTSLYLEYFNPIRDHIEADYYKKRTSSLLESTEYKIGKCLCRPFRLIKKLFGK